MGLFNKKKEKVSNNTELRCPAAGCSFTCSDHVSLKRHLDWKHPEMAQSVKKN
jgi:hypothetical protein